MAADTPRLGVAAQLALGDLPTGVAIYSHYLHLRKEKRETGVWKQNIPFDEVVDIVKHDVFLQWEKTGIPHTFYGREAKRKISNLIIKCQKLSKVPVGRRWEGFDRKLNSLFDVASCQHLENEHCTCDLMKTTGENNILYLK